MVKYIPVADLTVEQHEARKKKVNDRYASDLQQKPELTEQRKKKKSDHKKNLCNTNRPAFDKANASKHTYQKANRAIKRAERIAKRRLDAEMMYQDLFVDPDLY